MELSREARFNIDERLKTKEDQLNEAALLAHGLRIEVLADDGVVVPGQDVRVSITIGDRGRPVTVSSVRLNGFSSPSACQSGTLAMAAVYRCDAAARIPADARITKPYWKPSAERRAIRVRARRAVRPAVPAHTVSRVVRAGGGRYSC